MRLIVARLKQLTKSDKELQEYINRLITLSQLRKMDRLTTKISQEMLKYAEETHYLFRKGIQKGVKQGIEQGIEQGTIKEKAKKEYEFVNKLLLKGILPDEEISSLVGVTLAFVQKVKQEIAAKN